MKRNNDHHLSRCETTPMLRSLKPLWPIGKWVAVFTAIGFCTQSCSVVASTAKHYIQWVNIMANIISKKSFCCMYINLYYLNSMVFSPYHVSWCAWTQNLSLIPVLRSHCFDSSLNSEQSSIPLIVLDNRSCLTGFQFLQSCVIIVCFLPVP